MQKIEKSVFAFAIAASGTRNRSIAFIRTAAHAAVLIAALILAAGTASAELAMIEGTAAYPDQDVLQPGTALEVELLDISIADAPSTRLASIRTKVQDEGPIPFTLYYDPALIELKRTYSVSAKLILQNKVILRSDTVHPVLTHGAGASVDISLIRTAAEISAPPETADEVEIVEVSGDVAELIGPTWVAEDIDGKGVIDNLQSHITFLAEGRAQGSGGCNSFRGGYTLEGPVLNIGQLASLKMACPPTIMTQEARFHEALAQTRSYRIKMGLLYLIDGQGETVMRLWQRD